jgi:AcrR family transcriptional regulator
MDRMKKEKILDATVRLFLREGTRKVTMDEIAANAAVSKVTLYKYFGDKDALVAEAAGRLLSGCAARMEGIAASECVLADKMCDFLECVSDFAAGGHYGLCAELARYDDGAQDQYDRFLQVYRRALLALIDEGLSQGLFRAGLERDMVFHYIDMGVAHFRENPEYREKMLHDEGFRGRFMAFFVGNVFAGGGEAPRSGGTKP